MYTEYEMPETMVKEMIETNCKEKGKNSNSEMIGPPVKESLQHWINALKDDWTEND